MPGSGQPCAVSLTIAVTGPTGEIGISAVRALEADSKVERIVGMARRPSALEWLHSGRTSVVMDTGKAKSRLGWTPRFSSAQTLAALVEAAES